MFSKNSMKEQDISVLCQVRLRMRSPLCKPHRRLERSHFLLDRSNDSLDIVRLPMSNTRSLQDLVLQYQLGIAGKICFISAIRANLHSSRVRWFPSIWYHSLLGVTGFFSVISIMFQASNTINWMQTTFYLKILQWKAAQIKTVALARLLCKELKTANTKALLIKRAKSKNQYSKRLM